MAPLRPLPVKTLFGRVHLDVFGPFPVSDLGFKYILVIVDSYSRFPEAFFLKTQKAEEIAEICYSVFCRWGAPTSILTDLGKNFISKVMKVLTSCLKIKHLKTSSYHPCSNSQSEKFNSTILQAFCLHLSNDEKNRWPELLNSRLYAYRATHSVKVPDCRHLKFVSNSLCV